MKLRDNLAIFPVAAAGVCLEIFILSLWWMAGKGYVLHISLKRFLLVSHVYVIFIGIGIYLIGRRILKPFELILEGISFYGRGRWDYRIPSSSLQELDELARHLNHMAAKLSELDNLKNDFIANVSHELRSPLAAMEDYVRILLTQTEITGKNRENLLRVSGNLERLRHLVEELLDISQIESKQMRLQKERIHLPAMVREVCAFLKPRLDSAHIALETIFAQDAVELDADSAKLRQILANLLDNAVKYNRPGGRIRIKTAQDGTFLLLSIEDTGPGIPSEYFEIIFERFRRLPPLSPDVAKGVGLGLAISRTLARAMRGDIHVGSTVGAGSAFTIKLPLREDYGNN
ncbi:MAG: HAMP domain-containing sensor histidine kinase [Elusimicrobiota bacterium]